jgi:DNA-binding response OmpR family regulator
MRILIVEDEAKLATALQRGLAEHSYAVDVAADGEEALLLARVTRYDLIVLDVMLPKLDGFSVTRELRAERYEAPILILTARDSVEDRVTGLDRGADDYLVKPFAFHELLARVRALLRRGRLAAPDPILRVADLEINTITHQAKRAGKPLNLTTKEYAILEYLARHPNQVVGRTQIAEHVWDYSFDAMSNVIDVYIGYLRRKLGDNQEPRLLHTVRGAGYQLRTPDE